MVSIKLLKILAFIVWITGSFILLIKGYSLTEEAKMIIATTKWPLLSILFGFLLGIIKAKYLFISACRKNIARIENLSKPKIWQFYKPWFFLFLFTMIMLGAGLSKLAYGNFILLNLVAILDMGLGFALLFSSSVFLSNYLKNK